MRQIKMLHNFDFENINPLIAISMNYLIFKYVQSLMPVPVGILKDIQDTIHMGNVYKIMHVQSRCQITGFLIFL